MTNTANKTPGCLSGVLRLVLCKRSLQTHPSDQITEPYSSVAELEHTKKDAKFDGNVSVSSRTKPGVVARLMGLDSLPDSNWVVRTPDSVARSKSVNFADCLLEFDLSSPSQGGHRRVRTSLSFREVPKLVSSQENRDVLVLYVGDDDNNVNKIHRSKGAKLRKLEVGLPELEQRKNIKKNNKENCVQGAITKEKGDDTKYSKKNEDSKRVRSCNGVHASLSSVHRRRGKISKEKSIAVNPKPINQSEILVESKLMKKIKKNKLAEKERTNECNKENNSSPVSVLGVSDFRIHSQSSLIADETNGIDTNYFSYHCSTSDTTGRATEKKKKNNLLSNKHNLQYYAELTENVRKMTEEDINESNWVFHKAHHDYEIFEELYMNFGQHILDLLLSQAIEEITGLNTAVINTA